MTHPRSSSLPTPASPRVEPSDRVVVVGAGIVGLSTAWHLQERGADVTVVDRDHVAAGSSWGNAGWLTPGLTAPLPDPGVLRYGLRTALRPSSPVYVPLQPDLRLLRFLTGFARHCTHRRWEAGLAAYAPLNALALDAFDELAAEGQVPAASPARPFLAGFRTAKDRAHLLAELELLQRLGQPLDFGLLTGDEARAIEPALSEQITAGVRIEGQRFIDPPVFLEHLARSFVDRGGKLLEGVEVSGLRDDGRTVDLAYAGGTHERFHAAVLATGAWLGGLAHRLGVRRLVQAGRGYSFSVAGSRVPQGPVYFPTQRVACTPLDSPDGPRLRVAGMMEFRSPDAPLDRRRVEAIVDATRPLLSGLDLADRRDEWVGSRPCTTDGLPLVGGTRSPRVFVAGGHGMWGVALGPVTGRLLAEQMVTGAVPAQLAPFDPLR
ncbi:FAD-binding oxidoreductase [Nocardioides sp. cx-173]|uniref:NAD(P)/FAD-dependent oxidoreductase n=1 Tax=Nocardioides sp. cx-173 TaxID=2898796 RepID=UPI001E4C8F0D|nr:FAD-dependent oxidoreductase [Nocardioides sp. cx-173]MCD4527302.1 FAD-binding oxidoreductase [Nocardioides sp. cx-173]UGB43601.1 FAD-binding oxidoreductase [Nocardioides sp. cx-173]